MVQLATTNARSGGSQYQSAVVTPTWRIRTLVIISRQLVCPGHNQPRDSCKRPGLHVVRHDTGLGYLLSHQVIEHPSPRNVIVQWCCRQYGRDYGIHGLLDHKHWCAHHVWLLTPANSIGGHLSRRASDQYAYPIAGVRAVNTHQP